MRTDQTGWTPNADEITRLRAVNAELLAALRAFRERAQCGCTVAERHSGHKLGCEMAELMETADAAIARAEGQS